MKVFISSTCHDLLDLRAELHEDLRDLGVEPIFSDIKESDFQVASDAATNSIETCLVNVRASDVVIVVLSQRYGPRLPPPFDPISATHAEYREARKLKKPIYFYIRSQLVADWSSWKRNGRSPNFKSTWAKDKDDDAKALFTFMEEHQSLVRSAGTADANNWYWSFTNSVDLRADIRRRLSPEAHRATAEKLVRTGQVPLIVVVGRGAGLENRHSPNAFYRFSFQLVNAGPVPAIRATASLIFDRGSHFDATVPVILPGNDGAIRPACNVSFEIPKSSMDAILDLSRENQVELNCKLVIAYRTPTGHAMEDHQQVTLNTRNEDLPFTTGPTYLGKSIAGMAPLLLPS